MVKKNSFSKKAEVEVQFNWIFILIAGGLILALFATMVLYQKKNSDYKSNANLLNHMQGLLSGARISSGTDYTIMMPSITLQIECDRYKIKGSGLEGKRLTNWVFFGMSEQSGNTVYMASRPWMSPYLVDYILYITSDDVHYTIIEGAEGSGYQRFAEELSDALPKNTKQDIITDPTMMIDRGQKTERMVTFGIKNVNTVYGKTQPKNLIDKGKSISLINILTPTDIDGAGKFEYWEFDNTLGWVHIKAADGAYMDLATLMGAVFADHNSLYGNLYQCNMDKLFNRLGFISKIYQAKSEIYMGQAVQKQSTYPCSSFYDPSNIGAILSALNKTNSTNINMNTMESIQNEAENLKNKNLRLQSMGCPSIY